MPLISVVMPALNERPFVAGAVKAIPVDILKSQGYTTEIIVIDNASDDGTGELAKAAGATVVVEDRRGYGFAYQKGFQVCKGDIVCALDADQTYPAEMLPHLVEKLVQENLDFVSTNRFAYLVNGDMNLRNRWGNTALSLASRLLFGIPFKDSQSGMWVLTSDLLNSLTLEAGGMAFSEEIKIKAWRRKARCAEVPIKYHHRNGTSKLRVWRDGIGNLVHLARLRLN